MGTPKIKVTYSLDPDTVKELERLAGIWKTSKSGALRRALTVAAATEPRQSRLRSAAHAQIAALRELQESMALSDADAEAWVRQVRESRRGWPKRGSR